MLSVKVFFYVFSVSNAFPRILAIHSWRHSWTHTVDFESLPRGKV